ncbi:MAG: tautomerase family protein [Ectothiorhodospiraceae bacterium]|nr:tautomerase family protein [Ectothiorhodospiraceae bacterium]
MPFLKIQTNQALDPAQQQALMAKASSLVAEKLGKPENYVMVAIETGQTMQFAGTSCPLAYLELKSIGLPADETRNLSDSLCTLVSQELDVEKNRTYIEFADAQRNMWGWDGGTF